MRKLLALITFFALPLFASAHASPVEYIPAASAELGEAPTGITIRFSERLEEGASSIRVKDAAGKDIAAGAAAISKEDRHILSVALLPSADGVHTVSWSVVSADDGHFTKGSYLYVVGEGQVAASLPQVEVVQSSAIPEAAAIFVELLGNSLLWGALVLFGFLLSAGEFRRAYALSVCVGFALIVLGGASHLVLKTLELAKLQEVGVMEALRVYLGTVSGSATVWRSVAGLLFALVFFLRERIAFSSWVLAAILAAFAYLRSIVSHATANPFFPELSVSVNLLHLIGKDLWAGLVILLSLLLLLPKARAALEAVLPKAFRAMVLASLVTGVTAAYIVWLHLKDFHNLSATLWGERFLPLLAAALIAVALLAYHVLAARLRPALFSRLLPYTLPAEAAAGVAIVFLSSLIIITSPPLSAPPAEKVVSDQGVRIAVSAAPYEDGKALVSVSEDLEPIVFLDGSGEDQGIIIDLEKRFPGGYVFPLSFIEAGKEHRLSVTVAQPGGYDAHADFALSEKDFEHSEGRRFDSFTVCMILIGLGAALFSLVLLRLSAKTYPRVTRHGVPAFLIGSLVAAFAIVQASGLLSMVLGNSYKRECVADGNGWHLMLPSRNGVPISSTPAEGCMALGGSFHIPDAREYRYLRSPGESTVVFENDLSSIAPYGATRLRFSLSGAGEIPLSVIHDRLMHMIVVSSDMKDFFHVHPEQVAPGEFEISFAFPRPGQYLLALDYAYGLTPVSKTFPVRVGNAAPAEVETYPGQTEEVDGYTVALDRSYVIAGEPTTMIYRITKDGKDVTDLEPYLAAAMHLAIVKNDLSEFVHTHGEVHPPGTPIPPPSVSLVHQHTPPPPAFGPVVEAHVIFPSSGRYTVFGEFMHEGQVHATRFTVDVE
jgi:methionine-rich copper-binding protein CopC